MSKRLHRMSDPEFYSLIAEAPVFEAIIKGAIGVEVEMEEVFSLHFVDFDSLVEMRLTYDQKVKLMIAIGLERRFASPLMALAKIRNRFAHNLDAQFSASDADNFYATFAKEDRRIMETSLSRIQDGMPPDGHPREFKEFDGRDKLALCIVTLRSAMKAAQLETIRKR
ncbi:hypothetical protein [Agrobacterium tumefaciens]|uniref:hypothetical protein n=1 Tax=Agrobacterium tumefaciens TaxID=358 RepID=UPI00220DA865|nr:hypothetical protein FY157_04375 [Agrobacterium tumefaciens]